MITITKERLLTIKQWRETYGPGSNVVLPAEEAEELARIALASLEAKPIGAFHIAEQQVDGTSDYIKDGEWPIDNGTIEVYAASPAPVVPEEKPMPNPLGMYAVDAVAAIAEVRGWNACRAAMLHGAEPVSQTYKLPVNTPCQDAPAHIWLQTAGVWPEDGELSELTWCSHNQHHDDTLYVRADLVNGNSPVTPARLPGGFTIEDAKALHEDLVRSHISQALSGEKMKKNDRDADLRWIHGVIVQAAWFVKASLEQNALSGNYPVTPDGWISCSDRMPEDTKMLLAFSQGEIVAAYWNWVVNPIDYKKYRAFTYLSGNILDDVTHWMPLPEPPQEEVNRG
ncbi:DUF551 domain-containing protein [Escherichia coli]|nr:DUF551 domain-containing protein [Escherichia coli]